MKLPLFLYGRPSLNVNGPLVHLPSGTWVIESNHKDSSLVLLLDDVQGILIDGMKVNGGVIAQVNFTHIGSEPQITIYAHRENGTIFK